MGIIMLDEPAEMTENKYGTLFSRSLEDRARYCLGNPTMAHIDTNAVFVHPSVTGFWIIIQVQGVIVSRTWGSVVTAVCP
jgi:hypothetical protein